MEKLIDFVIYSLEFLSCYFLAWVAVSYLSDVLQTDLSKPTLRSATGSQAFWPLAGGHRKTTPHPVAEIRATATRSKKNIYAKKK